jgi:hypothetical protein
VQPENTIPPPEVADEWATLSVTGPTESRPTILLAAAGTGVSATVELSASGAFALARLLRSASVHASAAAWPRDEEE